MEERRGREDLLPLGEGGGGRINGQGISTYWWIL